MQLARKSSWVVTSFSPVAVRLLMQTSGVSQVPLGAQSGAIPLIARSTNSSAVQPLPPGRQGENANQTQSPPPRIGHSAESHHISSPQRPPAPQARQGQKYKPNLISAATNLLPFNRIHHIHHRGGPTAPIGRMSKKYKPNPISARHESLIQQNTITFHHRSSPCPRPQVKKRNQTQSPAGAGAAGGE